ncbi:MAG: DUF2147 domain-containing protein [Bryobacteraceae bacterium]
MRIRSIALSFLLMLPGMSAAASGDDILGKWLSPSDVGSAHIEIFKEGGKYRGKIVWLERPVFSEKDPLAGKPKTDRRNSDPTLRSRPVMGLVMLEGMEYGGGNEWKNGTIYAPDKGKTYKCQLKLGTDGVLHVRGYIGFSMFGENRDWTRVK